MTNLRNWKHPIDNWGQILERVYWKPRGFCKFSLWTQNKPIM